MRSFLFLSPLRCNVASINTCAHPVTDNRSAVLRVSSSMMGNHAICADTTAPRFRFNTNADCSRSLAPWILFHENYYDANGRGNIYRDPFIYHAWKCRRLLQNCGIAFDKYAALVPITLIMLFSRALSNTRASDRFISRK
jgi:hypothetical protein